MSNAINRIIDKQVEDQIGENKIKNSANMSNTATTFPKLKTVIDRQTEQVSKQFTNSNSEEKFNSPATPKTDPSAGLRKMKM